MSFSHSPEPFTGELEYWQYDTFIARWNNRAMNADAYVIRFRSSPTAPSIKSKMAAVSPLTDFSYDFHHLALIAGRRSSCVLTGCPSIFNQS